MRDSVYNKQPHSRGVPPSKQAKEASNHLPSISLFTEIPRGSETTRSSEFARDTEQTLDSAVMVESNVARDTEQPSKSENMVAIEGR